MHRSSILLRLSLLGLLMLCALAQEGQAQGATCAGAALVTAQVGAPPRHGLNMPLFVPTLALDGVEARGRRVPLGAVLEGIVLPAYLGAEARQELEARLDRLEGRRITLHAARMRLDRRERLGGQAIVMTESGVEWLQARLLAEGVVLRDDTEGPCTPLLAAAEEEARINRRGLWARKESLILDGRTPRAIALPDFVLLQGRLVSIGKTAGSLYLNFGPRSKRDTTLRLPARIAAQMQESIRKRLVPGAHIRVRGWAEDREGLTLALFSPWNLEILEDAKDKL